MTLLIKKYRNTEELYYFIKEQITDSNIYYILLDEVQLVSEFEDVLNGLLYINNVDTYVTGSNAKFLSKDIITEFRGRGNQIHVLPLSFAEYLSVYQGDKYSAFNEYLTYDGLPFVTSLTTHEQKNNYLTNLMEQIYIKDIINRYKIHSTDEFIYQFQQIQYQDLLNILKRHLLFIKHKDIILKENLT